MLCLKTFASRYPKTCREHFCVSESFWYRQKLGIRRSWGLSGFSVEIVSSHSTETFHRGTLVFHVFQKHSGFEKIVDKRSGREGASRYSVVNALFHSAEKIYRGILLCFRKCLGLEIVEDKRGVGQHAFPLKVCCLTTPKKFVGENFGV